MDAARHPARAQSRLRVIIVDDDLYVRTHLRTILNGSSQVTCVATYASGDQAVVGLRTDRPAVALVDINMPGPDGAATTRAIRLAAPSVQVLALTSLTDEHAAAAMIDAGASGFLTKDLPTPAMINAICAAATGLHVLSGASAQLIATEPYRDRPHLTAAEQRVLTLVMDGRTNIEIAAELGVTPSAVKYHLTNLIARFGVTNRVTLAVRASEQGFH